MARNPEVDRWFADEAHPLDGTMQRVRDVILKADARFSELMKYGSPTFFMGSDFAVFVQREKKHVTLMFHRGVRISGKFPHLVGTHPSARFMLFADEAEAKARSAELTAVARAWCALQDGTVPDARTVTRQTAAKKARPAKKTAKKKTVARRGR